MDNPTSYWTEEDALRLMLHLEGSQDSALGLLLLDYDLGVLAAPLREQVTQALTANPALVAKLDAVRKAYKEDSIQWIKSGSHQRISGWLSGVLKSQDSLQTARIKPVSASAPRKPPSAFDWNRWKVHVQAAHNVITAFKQRMFKEPQPESVEELNPEPVFLEAVFLGGSHAVSKVPPAGLIHAVRQQESASSVTFHLASCLERPSQTLSLKFKIRKGDTCPPGATIAFCRKQFSGELRSAFTFDSKGKAQVELTDYSPSEQWGFMLCNL